MIFDLTQYLTTNLMKNILKFIAHSHDLPSCSSAHQFNHNFAISCYIDGRVIFMCGAISTDARELDSICVQQLFSDEQGEHRSKKSFDWITMMFERWNASAHADDLQINKIR